MSALPGPRRARLAHVLGLALALAGAGAAAALAAESSAVPERPSAGDPLRPGPPSPRFT